MKVHQMKRLAVRYGVPVSLFTDPPMTDDERLAKAIADAAALEREDSDEAAGARPRVGGGPVEPRRRPLS
jgi:hypothetical protein